MPTQEAARQGRKGCSRERRNEAARLEGESSIESKKLEVESEKQAKKTLSFQAKKLNSKLSQLLKQISPHAGMTKKSG
ncbi:hypothetical protein I5M27_01975 [Adhaeribacter sp. BT258]|uniref:Uncharacterized protein n=1 Tax=Adhaeribacter terrigena TaxID=2793070 RepID=A0ABS1BZC5_9BACT|nr:hypothetical protein [Adhaeribacter terrigena]MBK0401733.1 hypothetical protein [Adhaeribacter terrigena]